MNNLPGKLVFIFLIAAIAMVSPVSFAQDTSGDTQTGGESTSAADSIVFDTGEDASLFVGQYRINTGDTVEISLITITTNTYSAMVDDEGYIAIPVIGRVLVYNLTSTEARQAIQNITDEYYRNAWITFRIASLGIIKFYVYGDVLLPGFYTASGATTFFDFLQKFGIAGTTNHRRIVHVRGERNAVLPEQVNLIGEIEQPFSELIDQSLDLYTQGKTDEIDPRISILDPLEFTREGQIETRNFYLEYGDIIYVPDPETSVNMTGFRRPGEYEVLPGETWSNMITLAGQPDSLHDLANMLLEKRDDNGDLISLYYNLNLLDETGLAEIPLDNHDQMEVLLYDLNVYVLGEVNEPGAIEYATSLAPLEYISMAGGTTENAQMRFAVIVRPPADHLAPIEDSEVFQVDLVETVLHGRPSATVAIEPGDIIFVPDKGQGFTMDSVFTSLSFMVNAIRLF
ncbi:MAG: SLBB domain-containing protein [bacterium]|nr:SLBB domain-containing protein [bacterium]